MSIVRSAQRHALIAGILAVAGFGGSTDVYALPSFANQTGQACVACHVSFPELTPYGRLFKLSGYTVGQRQSLPLSLMGQVSNTTTSNNHALDADGNTFEVNARDRSTVFTGASLFVAGKATDNLGTFIQYTYNHLSADPNTGELKGHSGIDNTDIRLVAKYLGTGSQEPDLYYGLTLHNNPTVQDVWNTTPAFGFPFTSSPLATTPAAATLIDGGLAQQVAGLGGYLFWKKTLYGELSFYRTADGVFSLFRKGQDIATQGGVSRLDGYNPYWRFAYNREWGSNSLMAGTYGMVVKKFFNNLDTTMGIDRFIDTAVDAQYQYITDPHTFNAQTSFIHERQNLSATFMQGASANPSNKLNTFKAKATYYYQRKYGATLGYVSTKGSSDAGLYSPMDAGGNLIPVTGSASGSPDSKAYTFQLDYLPIENVRLMLQYIKYRKFNGGTVNYDGLGRNASNNNTLFLNLWFALGIH